MVKMSFFTLGQIIYRYISVIGGGDFWSGVRQGLITSGLNHTAHVGASSIEAGLHARAARAFLVDSGFDPVQVSQDVVKQSDGPFGQYYAFLNNESRYIGGWSTQYDSYSGGDGYVSKPNYVETRAIIEKYQALQINMLLL